MKLVYLATAISMGLGLLACGSPEPVATGYKKQLSTVSSSPQPGTGDATPVTPGGTTPAPAPTPAPATANLANGQAIYNANCSAAGCHGPLASSNKANRTAAQLEAGQAAFSGHTSVGAAWPKGANAVDVAAALKR